MSKRTPSQRYFPGYPTSLAILVMAAALVGWLTVHQAFAAAPAGKTVDLFDGKTFDGWDIIGCEAEIQDKAILIKSALGPAGCVVDCQGADRKSVV